MLKLDNVNITAGSFKVKNISLNLQEGLCHVLVGTTGSGKTLLLETIAGLRRQESGSITFSGQDIGNLEPEHRHISYLPQDLCLFPNLTVRENVCYSLFIKKIDRAETARRLEAIANALDIAHLLDRQVDNLSGGEKHRTALARAIIAENMLLLLDEPFASLNLGIKRKLWHLLKKLQRQHGFTLLLVTHDLEEALFLGDDLSLIANGNLLDSGPKNQIYCYPRTVSAACILGTENFLKSKFVEKSGDLCHFHCPDLSCRVAVSAAYPGLSDSLSEGAGFSLAIRATDISICKPDAQNIIARLKIEYIYERGRTASLVLRSSQGDTALTAEVPIKEVAGLAPGNFIGIKIAPEVIMALAEG